MVLVAELEFLKQGHARLFIPRGFVPPVRANVRLRRLGSLVAGRLYDIGAWRVSEVEDLFDGSHALNLCRDQQLLAA